MAQTGGALLKEEKEEEVKTTTIITTTAAAEEEDEKAKETQLQHDEKQATRNAFQSARRKRSLALKLCCATCIGCCCWCNGDSGHQRSPVDSDFLSSSSSSSKRRACILDARILLVTSAFLAVAGWTLFIAAAVYASYYSAFHPMRGYEWAPGFVIVPFSMLAFCLLPAKRSPTDFMLGDEQERRQYRGRMSLVIFSSVLFCLVGISAGIMISIVGWIAPPPSLRSSSSSSSSSSPFSMSATPTPTPSHKPNSHPQILGSITIGSAAHEFYIRDDDGNTAGNATTTTTTTTTSPPTNDSTVGAILLAHIFCLLLSVYFMWLYMYPPEMFRKPKQVDTFTLESLPSYGEEESDY
jgi:hypothetical protein